MADNLHMLSFLNQAKNFILDDHPLGTGTLSLKVCQLGDIYHLLLIEDLSTFLPAVIIYPQRSVNPTPENTGPVEYLIDYFFYVLLADEFDKVSDPLTDKLTKTTALANTFLKNVGRFTDPDTNVQTLWGYAVEIDYRPQEEAILADNFSDALWASTILIQVSTSTERVS